MAKNTKTVKYDLSNVNVGDTVATQEDLDLAYGWGTVTAVGPKVCKAEYNDGDIYDVEWWAVVEAKRNGRLIKPLSVADADADADAPDTDDLDADADVDDSDDSEIETGGPTGTSKPPKPTSTPVLPNGVAALPAAEQAVRVWPGTIVTFSKCGTGQTKGLHKDRMWVVLNFTKGSQRKAVNIALVNGAQGDEDFKFDWMRVNIEDVTPVKFATYVRVPRKS